MSARRLFRGALVLACASTCLLGACPCSPELDSDQDSVTRNDTSMDTALKAAETTLAQQTDLAAIRTSLVEALKSDAQVSSAGVDSDLDAVWVDFKNGETRFVLFIDAANDTQDLVTDFATTKVLARPTGAGLPDRGATAKLDARSQAGGTGNWYRLPANNKALLVNALTPFHGNWSINDTTGVVEKMLEARGYDADRETLLLGHFTLFSKYAVILIETHGTWHKHAASSTANPDAPGFALFTATEATRDTREAFWGADDAGRKSWMNDLLAGLTGQYYAVIKGADGKVTRKIYYWGSPGLAAKHDTGKYPKNTLVVLNACRGFQDYSSPWADMVYEKCDGGATFFGWTAKVKYPYAARAALNLFQFLTASNEEVILVGTKGAATVLGKHTPPAGGYATPVNVAWSELRDRNVNKDPKSGAELTFGVQNNEMYGLCLMPHPIELDLGDSVGLLDKPTLEMMAESQPTVTVGGTAVTPQVVANSLGVNRVYTLSIPVGAHGDIAVTESNRTSITRPLHRWQPKINVKGSSGGLQYEVNFTLQARATAEGFRTHVWDAAPKATFDTAWDAAACVIGWSVSGSDTSGSKTSTYSGSGSKIFSDQKSGSNWGWGWMQSTDGTTVSLDVDAHVTYTTTTVDSVTGSTTTSDTEQTVAVTRTGVSLSSDWTLGQAAFSDTSVMLSGDTAQISWSASTPQPAFQPDVVPR